jgi:hypothetical protein
LEILMTIVAIAKRASDAFIRSCVVGLSVVILVAPDVADARKVILVTSTTQLYGEVNNADNMGALLVLSPMTYWLDPNAQNGGRLELQRDMGLQGMSADPTATIIDARNLTKDSYAAGALTTGAVRLGRGNNSLSLLTVQNATNGASGITTDLVDTSIPAHVQITSVLARNNTRGLDVRNIGSTMAGRTLTVDITTSVFMGNTLGPGQGIRIVNVRAPGAVIQANLSANRSTGNVAGCLSANLDTSGSDIVINSSADQFTGNGNGCVFIGGLRLGPAEVTGNSMTVKASASAFRDNAGPLPSALPLPGGIIAIGGQNVDAMNSASDNSLSIDLFSVKMGNNQGVDISGFGAYSPGPSPAGVGNEVVLRLFATGATCSTFDSQPREPAETNTFDRFGC